MIPSLFFDQCRTISPIQESTICPMGKIISVIEMILRIRDLREDKDLKQTDIAEYLICDQSLYSKYERGERELPLRHAIALAEFYGVSVDYLTGLTDERKAYPRKRK